MLFRSRVLFLVAIAIVVDCFGMVFMWIDIVFAGVHGLLLHLLLLFLVLTLSLVLVWFAALRVLFLVAIAIVVDCFGMVFMWIDIVFAGAHGLLLHLLLLFLVLTLFLVLVWFAALRVLFLLAIAIVVDWVGMVFMCIDIVFAGVHGLLLHHPPSFSCVDTVLGVGLVCCSLGFISCGHCHCC